jgi:serine/threonine-protein kinase
MNVAMALPGADPIAAALAAGETPSPEMVAASTEKEGFSPRTAILCFVGVVAFFLVGLFLSERISFLSRVPLPLPPEALADRAQQLLKSHGYTDAPSDVASGFYCCNHANEENVKQLDAARRAEILASHQPPVLHFWYRQHLKPFGPADGPFDRPTETSPPNFEAGMAAVNLDATGRLLRLQVQPWKTDSSNPEVNWPGLFSAAGLDFTRFSSIPSDTIPPMAFDAQFAWQGSYGDDRSEQLTVSSASWRGRPVFFEVLENQEARRPPQPGVSGVIVVVLVAIMSFLAWGNWRSGRHDRRGARVIAAMAFVGSIAAGIGFLSFPGAMIIWMLYVGVEPYARRFWPDSLISWTRFSHGRIRNPLVASHILVGIVFSSAFSYLFFPTVWWLLSPFPVNRPVERTLSSLGSHSTVAYIGNAYGGIIAALVYLTLLVLARIALCKRWPADLAAVLVFNLLAMFTTVVVEAFDQRLILFLLFLIPSLTWIPMMRWFGFLTMLCLWPIQMGMQTPLKTTGWMANELIVLHLIPIAIAAWALWVILSAADRRVSEIAV